MVHTVAGQMIRRRDVMRAGLGSVTLAAASGLDVPPVSHPTETGIRA